MSASTNSPSRTHRLIDRASSTPALMILAALLVLAIVPFIQYQNWVHEGTLAGDVAAQTGQGYFEIKEYDQAIQYYRTAIANYGRPLIYKSHKIADVKPKLAEAEILEGIGISNLSLLSDAKDQYQELLSSDRSTTLSERLADMKVLASGIDYWEAKNASAFPSSPSFLKETREIWLIIFEREKQYATAPQALEEAQKQNDSAKAAEARRLLEEASSYHARAAVLFQAAADILLANKNYPNAANFYLESLIQSPGSLDALRAATLPAEAGLAGAALYSQALELCLAPAEAEGGQALSDYCLAKVHQANGQFEQAGKLFERAQQADPKDSEIMAARAENDYLWGQALAGQGQPAAAMQKYTSAAQLKPDNPTYQTELADKIVTLDISGRVFGDQGTGLTGIQIQIGGESFTPDASGHFHAQVQSLSQVSLQVEFEGKATHPQTHVIEIVPGTTVYALDAHLTQKPVSAYPLAKVSSEITAGQPITQTLSAGEEVNIYIIRGQRNENDLINVNGQPYPSIEVWDEEHQMLYSMNPSGEGYNRTLNFSLPKTGNYFLVVKRPLAVGNNIPYDYQLALTQTGVQWKDQETTAGEYFSAGQSLASAGRLKAALYAYQRASELAPQDLQYAQAAQAQIVTITISGTLRTTRGNGVQGAPVFFAGRPVGSTDINGHFEDNLSFLSFGEIKVNIDGPTNSYEDVLKLDPGKTNYSLNFTASP